MTIQKRAEALEKRTEEFDARREHTLNGGFLDDLCARLLPSVDDETVFALKVAIQEQLQLIQREEEMINAEAEELKAEIAKEIEFAAKEGTDYPSYSNWKTSVRRTYTYDEEAIKAAAADAGVPEDRLYKVTTKFDPSALLKTGIPDELKQVIKDSKSVSKHTAVVKWAYEG